MEVAELLGFEYIWIDSLCIIQDSIRDWEEQSSLMAFIYSDADLVLAASSATSTEDGFLTERTAYRESILSLEGLRDKTSALRLRYRLLQRKGWEPMVDPLDRRAWALQERLLARRYLAFGLHEISWACMDSSDCECEWWRVATIWREEVRSVKSWLLEVKNDELGNCWRNKILNDYFRRRLSHQSDRLVALSALASMFASRMGSGYLAGLWRDDLHVGLLWHNLSPQSSYMDDRPSTPSWSWASLPLHYLDNTRRNSRYCEPLVKVLDATTNPSTVNQFGSISGGFIKLRSQLWDVSLTARNLEKTLYDDGQLFERLHNDLNVQVNGFHREEVCVFLDTSLIKTKVSLPNGARRASFRRIRRDEVQHKHYIAGFRKDEVVHFFMIPIFKQYNFRYEVDMINGLLVARSSRHPTFFERIGVFFFPERHGNEPGAPCAEKVEQEIIII